MSEFEVSKFNIKDEGSDAGEIRVVKLDTDSGPKVRDFSIPELANRGKGDYRVVKAKYGPLATTDHDRPLRGTRDNRFAVNPLLRDPLAIEAEEQRVIDVRVEEQVRAVREQARLEGEKKGYEAGLKKGRDEAYDEFKQEAAESLQSFQSFVQSFEALKAEIFKANERFLMELVFRVGRMLALKDLSTDADYVLRLSKQLLDQVGIRDNVKIRVNPKDVQSIEVLKAELAKQFLDLKNLGVEVSEEVELGGCAIETQWSAIDASLERQLNGIHQALLGGIENPKS